MKKRVGALALILACSIYANEEMFFEKTNVVKLEEMTISGDGFEKTIRDTPKNITIITSKDIEESGAKDIVEAVKSVPGVKVSQGMGNAGVIDIRGQGATATSNVAIILDGVKMNPIDMSAFNLYSIPIETVEKIEVIPSGASVVYGDNTVGGAINIITKDGTGKNYLSFQSEGGSDNKLNSDLSFNTSTGKFNIFGSVGRKRDDGYRDNGYLDADDVTLGTRLQLNENNAFTLKYDYHRDRMGLAGALNDAEIEEDRTQSLSNQWAKNESNRFNLGYNYKKNNLEIINNATYYKKDTFYATYSNTDYYTDNFSNDFKMKYTTDRNQLILGFDLLDGKLESDTDSTFGMYQRMKVKKQSIGGFISDTYSITEDLDIIGGVRQQYTKFKYSVKDKDKEYDTTVYNLALNYKYSDTGSTFISYGTDFRTPSTNELLSSNGYLNTDIKPQKGANFEVGLKDYIGDTFISSSIYHKIIKDEIYLDKSNSSGGYYGTNSNYDEDNRKIGFEILAERKLMQNFTLTGSYSFVQSEINTGEDKGNKTPGVPENKFSLGAKYEPTDKIRTNLLLNYVGSSYAFSDTQNIYDKVDSYTTLDLGVSYKVNSYFNIYGGIKNLTNEKYYEHVGNYGYGNYYYPAPEREYYIGFKYVM